MSRVLAGLQAPPVQLLQGLAGVPGVNMRWVLNGEGEPRTDRGLGWGGGHFCPVARELLPGPPQHHPELLTGTSLPVATAFHSGTAYWYTVADGSPCVTAGGGAVRPGDHLLFETAHTWTRRLGAMRGRLVSLRDPRPGLLRLAVVDADEDYFGLEESDVTLLGPGQAEKASLVTTRPQPVSPVEPPQGRRTFVLDDVAGVCLHLFRLLDRYPPVAAGPGQGSGKR